MIYLCKVINSTVAVKRSHCGHGKSGKASLEKGMLKTSLERAVTPYCVFAELVSYCVFEIRQLLVGDTLLSPEYWRASY